MLLKNNKILPLIIRLDATTICQLACPSCPTAKGEIGQSLGSQHLNLSLFKELLEANPTLRHIELSNWGEILLNPKLEQMIEMAAHHGVRLSASNGVNLNFIKPSVAEALVRYQFRHLVCSIDGATQETYAQYRIKGHLEKVIENIHLINKLKAKHQSPFPRLTWQFIIFKHNFHEIPLAKEKAKALNMNIVFKLSWDPKLAPAAEHGAWIKEQTGLNAINREEHEEENDEIYRQKSICGQMWNAPQINSDGRVLGCCVNTWGDYGTYQEGKLSAIVNGEKMVYARDMLMGKIEARQDIPCTQCSVYKKMQAREDWMTEADITSKKLV